MKAVDIDSKDAGRYKYAAYKDASLKSAVAQMNYTQKQQAKCLAMRYALESVYKGKEFHLTYRFKFTAALKIDEPQVIDKKMLDYLEDGWEQDPGVKVKKEASTDGRSVIYQVTVL